MKSSADWMDRKPPALSPTAARWVRSGVRCGKRVCRAVGSAPECSQVQKSETSVRISTPGVSGARR